MKWVSQLSKIISSRETTEARERSRLRIMFCWSLVYGCGRVQGYNINQSHALLRGR